MYPKIKQTNPNNIGITDVKNDKSLTRPGWIEHSGWDFTPELLGDFCIFLKNVLPEKNKYTVIEFGCGSGVMTRCLPESVFYLGLDANQKAGPEIKKLNDPKKQFIAVDLTAPFTLEPPIKADIIMSFDFFEHIEEFNLEPVIKAVDNLLKKDGYFFSIIDRFPLPEHITNKPIVWWLDIFKRYTNWKLIDACASGYNNNSFLWTQYEALRPKFWQGNVKHQMFVRYQKV